MPYRPLLLAAGLAVAAGCGWNDAVDSRAATAGLPSTRELVEEHEWVLERSDSSLTVDDDNPVTFSVRDDEVSGTAPCNRYRGEISLGEDESVEITDVALTLRECGGSTMDAEDEFVAALEAVDTVDVDEDDNERLVLHDDTVRLVFRSYDADELLVGTWSIVSVGAGDSVVSVLAGTEPMVTFTEDGDVSMATGCNTAASSWELDGHSLSIDRMAVTRMECDSPAGVMDQEAVLVGALEAADRVEIAPGELFVLDEEGSTTLVAVRE
jgi:heat shock protein HslJ